MKKIIFILLLGTFMFSQGYSKPDYGSGTVTAQTSPDSYRDADLGTKIQPMADALSISAIPVQPAQSIVQVAPSPFFQCYTYEVSHAIFKEDDCVLALEKSILRVLPEKRYYAWDRPRLCEPLNPTRTLMPAPVLLC